MSALDLATAEQLAAFCGCGARSFETMEGRLSAAGVPFWSRRNMGGVSLHPAVLIAVLNAKMSGLNKPEAKRSQPNFEALA